MWGSALSRDRGSSFPRSLLAHLRGRRRVSVRLGPALALVDADAAKDAVARLTASRP